MAQMRRTSSGILVLLLAIVAPARATDGIRTAGDALQLILPASAAGMTLARHDGKGTLQLAESAATSMGVTYGLKYSIHEERPDGGSHSFPSGHTSIAFCSAEFLRKRYGWKAGFPAFVVAGFVGYSRVEAKEHYVHDVLAGAAIGVISSEIFTRPYGCDDRLSAIIGRDVRLRATIEGNGRILVRFRIG